MAYVYFNAEFFMDMMGQMLCSVDTAMLSARATEREHETCESSLYISLDVHIGESINRFKEGEYLSVIF